MEGVVYTHNCRIWDATNPHQFLQIPLNPCNGLVRLYCNFIVCPGFFSFLFEEHSTAEPVTCTFTVQRCVSLLEQTVIPALQAGRCDTTTVFMQDGAPPHIARYLKQLLRHHSVTTEPKASNFLQLGLLNSPT